MSTLEQMDVAWAWRDENDHAAAGDSEGMETLSVVNDIRLYCSQEGVAKDKIKELEYTW